MGRRRLRLLEDPLEAKRRRQDPLRGETRPDGSPGAVEAALGSLFSQFPRGLFGGSLPPLALQHQFYALVRDRTAVDRHLEQLRRSGQILLLHLGLGPDALGVVSSDVYRDKVLQGVSGTPQAGVVRRFLEEVVAPCPRLSYERESGLGDDDVTQLVAAGVLTVRDAGSWWLALPGIGRFIRALLRGRRALLAVVRRSRNHEVLQGELLQRRAPPGTQLGVPYLLYDLLGAHLLCSVPTTSGLMLRLADT